MGSERDAGERDRSVAQLIDDQRRALIRLAGMLLLEQNDEWLVQRRYLSDHSLRQLLSPLTGGEEAGTETGDQGVIALNAA